MGKFSCEGIGFEEGPYYAANGHEHRLCKGGKHPCKPSECRKKWQQQCRDNAPLTNMRVLVRHGHDFIDSIPPNEHDGTNRQCEMT